MNRFTAITAAFLTAVLVSAPAFSQSSSEPAKPSASQGGMGTTGENGGSPQINPNGDGQDTKYYQPPVATGLDLKGPTKTEGPFAE